MGFCITWKLFLSWLTLLYHNCCFRTSKVFGFYLILPLVCLSGTQIINGKIRCPFFSPEELFDREEKNRLILKKEYDII